MNEKLNQFQTEYKQGRQETRQAFKDIKAGKGVSNDYAYKLSKMFIQIALIIGVISFILLIFVFHVNILISLILAIIVAWVALVVVGMGSGLILKKIAERSK